LVEVCGGEEGIHVDVAESKSTFEFVVNVA